MYKKIGKNLYLITRKIRGRTLLNQANIKKVHHLENKSKDIIFTENSHCDMFIRYFYFHITNNISGNVQKWPEFMEKDEKKIHRLKRK